MEDNIVIFDIETWGRSSDGKPNPEVDTLKYCGFKLPSGEYLIYSDKQISAIQSVFSRYKVFSGHNIFEYDIPILKRAGIDFYTRNKPVFIDTYVIASKRMESMMGYKGLGNGMKSLRFLAELFKLPSQKGDFDYNLLKKPYLTSEEYEDMKKYLIGDLDTSEALLNYFIDFFSGFRDMMSPENVRTYKWLTSSSGSNSYKVICFKAGIPELYNDNSEKSTFKAAISWTNPKIKYAENVYCFDFASLYPHMMVGGNLFSTVEKSDDAWHGGSGVYKSIEEDTKNGIRGYYSKDKGKVEQAIQDLYNYRVLLKKKMKNLDRYSDEYKTLDRKQYAVKITINTAYGISGNPRFKQVYDLNRANDITAMARASITHAKDIFTKSGYEILYQHTDSLYIIDRFDNPDRIKDLAKQITEEQKKYFNIPIDTHNFEFEEYYKKMWLVQGDDNNNIKNRNIRVTEDDKVKFTGIKMQSLSTSQLAKKTFWTYITPALVNGKKDLYFDPMLLKKYLKDISKEEPKLLEVRKKVWSLDAYKSKTSIQYQISERYGEGVHNLIANGYIGVGKSKKYCTREELEKSFGDKWLDAVDYSAYLRDLSEFIKPELRKKLK